MLISDDAELDTAYVCPHFTSCKERSLELALPQGSTLVKTPLYAHPPMLEEFLNAQSMDANCKQAAAPIGITGTAFSYDRFRILVYKSAVDKAIQKAVPVPPKPAILYLAHHLILA